MKAKRRILLYGNSVILGTIGASLRRVSQFEVTPLASLPQDSQKVNNLKPDIVLFNLETTQPEAVLSLLEINPDLQLIVVSPDINLVKVWSIRELREVSTQDLLKMIKSEARIRQRGGCGAMQKQSILEPDGGSIL